MEQVTSSIARNCRHGYRAFSPLLGASYFGFRISVLGIVGIVGFAVALMREGKFWEKRKMPSEKLHLVPGLQNLGNNCFLNVILQALASCSYFQCFLQKILDKCESLPTEGEDDNLPLTITLSDLLEELCKASERRVTLNPRKVMCALAQYVENFDLARQQDAAEAFLHLLTSLREEFSDAYLPSQSNLAVTDASQTYRILTLQRMEDESELERWRQYFLGPFGGIICSILTCQTCSSQISLDFQFFYSLPLLPVVFGDSAIVDGSTLEDCLRQFVSPEHVENYYCSHCWHIAAVKFLSSTGVNEMEIERLKRCSGQDSCDCRSFLFLEKLPWSNNYSSTLKQFSIARSPNILCIHLQRASVNMYGELIKLQGHISFPLILDLSPFITTDMEIKKSPRVHNGQVKLQNQRPSPFHNLINARFERNFDQNVSSKLLAANDKMNLASHSQLSSSKPKLYQLVSVVEHFGRVGGGHYTVYRSMKAESNEGDCDECSEPATRQWFCISDSEVRSVTVEDVLAAEASLLFYERIK